ncbi:hypothetical protein B0H13DRAFT_2331339 [Mycena leptocephala]|nr:hypothetical protein B0H13DRAFT_2331339 [Mycena leptocephala]
MESLALISHMESAPSFAAEALALNPRPNCQMGSCQMCRGHMLPLVQALNGTNVTNWARWMQKCQQCGWFYWHNDPTAIEHIPEGVQIPDEQCIGLDDEIARLMIDGSEESAREKTRRLLALSGSGHNQSQQQQARSYMPTLFQPAAAITSEPPVIDDSDDGEDLQYDVMRARKEVYSYFEEGRLQSGSVKPDVPIEEMDVLGQYSPDGIELASVAVKSLLLSDADAVAMWVSREMAVWSEAARQAECHLQYALFKSKAAAVDLDLSAVEILSTFLFSCLDKNVKTFIAQPWECGVQFSFHSLDHQSAAYQTLSAFSHFTYETRNHRSVYVDFQGFQTVNGYRVFDSLTHIIDHTDSPSDYPALGSLGRDGIEQFVQNHTCGSTCQALDLNPLPPQT